MEKYKVLFKPFIYLSKLPGLTKYYAVIALLFLTKNLVGVITTVKAETVLHDSILGKVFSVFLTFIKFFTKKAIFSDIGVYEATKELQQGTVSILHHVNLLTDIFLGLGILFLALCIIAKFDAFSHSSVLGMGSWIMALALFYFSMGYIGIKISGDMNYQPFGGTVSFLKLVWENPTILSSIGG